MTRNLWVQRGTAIVQWRARIQRDVATPEVALRLLERCADAGRGHGMFVCDTDPVDYARAAWARENQLRLSLEDADAAADLWWYGSSDAKVHGLVRDLGALLEALPEGAQKIDADYRAEGPSPVNIWGSLVDHDDPREHLTLFVSLYSDIWMPYVKGLAHPNYTENAYFDNTELATSHTPPLQRLLGGYRSGPSRYARAARARQRGRSHQLRIPAMGARRRHSPRRPRASPGSLAAA